MATIQYQPVTGPVWREPVADRLQWLPTYLQRRELETRRPSESVEPFFQALYKPEGLQWLMTFFPRRELETRKLSDSVEPFFEALYKSEGLQWIPSGSYPIRLVERRDSTTVFYPFPVAAVVYDPQTLEWIPSGIRQTFKLEDRIISSWVVDPTTPPDVIPPPPIIVTPPSLAGGAYLGPAKFKDRYDRRKRKSLEEQLRELLPHIEVKKTEIVIDVPKQQIENLRVDLQTIAPTEIERAIQQVTTNDDDEELLRVAAFMLL